MSPYIITRAQGVRLIESLLTHWGWVTHICVSELTIIGSDSGLSPGRHQAIIWTNAGIVLIRTSGTNFSEILGKTHSFSFKKMHLKMSSAKGHLFSLGLNELKYLIHNLRIQTSLIFYYKKSIMILTHCGQWWYISSDILVNIGNNL